MRAASTVTAISFPDPAGGPGRSRTPPPCGAPNPGGPAGPSRPRPGCRSRDRLLAGPAWCSCCSPSSAPPSGWRVRARRRPVSARRGSGADDHGSTRRPPTSTTPTSGRSRSSRSSTSSSSTGAAPSTTRSRSHYLTRRRVRGRGAATETRTPPPEDKADLEDVGAGELRALGLVGPDVDLQDATEPALRRRHPRRSTTRRPTRSRCCGTDLDVAHRVTLVHELTHAWQDQHGVPRQARRPRRRPGLHAAGPGRGRRHPHRGRVRRLALVERPSRRLRPAVRAAGGRRSTSAVSPTRSSPAFGSPYVLGAPFVRSSTTRAATPRSTRPSPTRRRPRPT